MQSDLWCSCAVIPFHSPQWMFHVVFIYFITVCKSCIVKYLQTSKYCPMCNIKIHETQPLLNLKLDRVMQDIVFKLVPGLQESEYSKPEVTCVCFQLSILALHCGLEKHNVSSLTFFYFLCMFLEVGVICVLLKQVKTEE